MIDHSVTVAHPWWARVMVWTGLPAAGAGLAVLLCGAARWLMRQEWAPTPGPVRLIADLPDPPATIGAVVVGALAGLVLAALVDQESLRVTLSPTEVTLSRPGTTRVLDRSTVATAFPDGDRLVLLDGAGAEVAREPSHLPTRRLAAAFAAYGVGWSEADPFADDYRRWVPESPDLPAGARALLTARDRALKAGDTHDIAELRAELARCGVVVRDEKTRQYWRRVG